MPRILHTQHSQRQEPSTCAKIAAASPHRHKKSLSLPHPQTVKPEKDAKTNPKPSSTIRELLTSPSPFLIHEHQAQYYEAHRASTAKTDSEPFISFMLEMIQQTLSAFTPQVTPQATPQVERLLAVLDGSMSRDDLLRALGLRDRKSFRERYLKPALDLALIEMTIPHKPNSSLQKYRLTTRGQRLLSKE